MKGNIKMLVVILTTVYLLHLEDRPEIHAYRVQTLKECQHRRDQWLMRQEWDNQNSPPEGFQSDSAASCKVYYVGPQKHA